MFSSTEMYRNQISTSKPSEQSPKLTLTTSEAKDERIHKILKEGATHGLNHGRHAADSQHAGIQIESIHALEVGKQAQNDPANRVRDADRGEEPVGSTRVDAGHLGRLVNDENERHIKSQARQEVRHSEEDKNKVRKEREVNDPVELLTQVVRRVRLKGPRNTLITALTLGRYIIVASALGQHVDAAVLFKGRCQCLFIGILSLLVNELQ